MLKTFRAYQPTRSLFRNYSTSQTKLRILHSSSTDPFINLATEDWIYNECDPSYQYLYLWRNDKTVVIGKHQNPYKDLQKMEQDGVHLTRRRSGGGAVYQDLGNTIFTFLSPKQQYDKATNFQILTRALDEGFGIKAQVSGRNDIVISSGHPEYASRKISGCAFKVGSDRAFHHGTLMVNVDLNALQNYLNPHKLKLQSKGVTSVISRVVNLKEMNPEITHEKLNTEIIKSFLKQYNELGNVSLVEEIDQSKLYNDASFQKYHNELKDWNWRFGKTPEFSNNFETRFEWGLVDVYIQSHEGMIKQVKIYSDTLFPIIVELFQQHLIGKQLSSKQVAETATQIKAIVNERQDVTEKQVIHNCVDDLSRFIISNI